MESEITNNDNKDEVESKLRCSFNPKLHFICHKPVVLKCQPQIGYSTACLECISQKVDYTGKFKCPLCENEHRKEEVLEKSKTYEEEMGEYEKTLKNNLKIAFQSMLSKAKKLHSQINEKFSVKSKNYVIRNTIEHFEHTMLVRVESLKIEMEKLERRANKRIERFRTARKRSHSEELLEIERKFQILRAKPSNGVDVLKAFEMLMLNLSTLNERFNYEEFNNTSNSKINRTTLNSYQQYCLSNRIRTFSKKNSLPNRSILGFLSGYNSLEISPESELKLEVIYLGKQLKSCCGIAELFGASKNQQIAMTDYSSNSIKVVSKHESYELTDLQIEEIEMFRLVKFKNFYAICTDYDETSLRNVYRNRRQMNLFICDMDLNRVLIYDFGIKKLKRIITGTLAEDGKSVDEFECPRDICYYDGTIYVLDQVKNSIEIFTSSGDYLRSFYFNSDYFTGRQEHKLVEDPLSVRVNLNTIAIIDWKKSVVLFDLEFNLRGSIEQFNLMSICLVSDCLNPSSLKIFLHSQTGEFIGYSLFTERNRDSDSSFDPKVIIKRDFDDLKCSSEFMVYSLTTKSFILTLGWSKSIAIIRI